jgi:hypothetical protein
VSTEAERVIASLPEGNAIGQVPRHARKTLLAIASFMKHRPGRPEHAVCFATQASIGNRCGANARTVRSHVAELEKLGVIYREPRHHSGTGRGGASDRLRIRGYGDQPATISAWSHDDGPRPTGNESATKRQPLHDQAATVAANTYRDQERPNAGATAASIHEHPHAGPSGQRGRGSEVSEGLDSARALGAAEAQVVEHLLGPVLLNRRLDAEAVAATCRGIARRVADKRLSERALIAAAELVLAKRNVTVRPADFYTALEHTSVRLADKIEIHIATPQWAAWIRHYERTSPSLARIIADCSTWRVDSEWPERGIEQDEEAA